MYFDFGVLTYFSYRIQERLDRCGDNVCVGAETVVHFAFVGDLYVYFTQVVASPGDGLYQVFFQMYPSFGDAFYSIDGCIDRAVTAGCFGMEVEPHTTCNPTSFMSRCLREASLPASTSRSRVVMSFFLSANSRKRW